MDRIELYAPAKGSPEAGLSPAYTTGDLLPFSSRPIAHRNFLFPLHARPGSTSV